MDDVGLDFSGASLTDRVGLGVLTRLVTRDLVSEVVSQTGRGERRSRLLPARVVVYFVLALALFSRDSYEEVMRKLVQGLTAIGTWREAWRVPTASALCQARKRLGVEPLRELFERVAIPCGYRSTAGAWKCGRRLVAIDGIELDIADTAANVAYFGYHGKTKTKDNCAFPSMLIAAAAECGTHAIFGAEPGVAGEGEHTLAKRLAAAPGVLEPDMLVMVDRGLYSYELLSTALATGADVCFRVNVTLELPVLRWLPDGSYLSYIAEPHTKARARKRKPDTYVITELPGHYVRVVDYEVPGRGEKNELFTLVTNIIDHEDMTSIDLAEAYHERWEIELAFDEIETHQRGPELILRSKSPDMVLQEMYGLLITHYAIRQIMTDAADPADLDPDRLSFTRSLNIIRRQITSQAGFSPSPPPESHP